MAKSKNGEALSSAGSNVGGDDKLRLKCSQLQAQMKTQRAQLAEKDDEIFKLNKKVGQIHQLSRFRLEAQKHAKTCEKLTQRLLVLERNEQKIQQYEELKRQLQETMILDDEEQAARAEEEARRLAEEEEAKAQAEAEAEAAEAERDSQEVSFDEEKANYQEDNFMKHSAIPMSNKDIHDAVGLEYNFVSYEEKPKVKKKAWQKK